MANWKKFEEAELKKGGKRTSMLIWCFKFNPKKSIDYVQKWENFSVIFTRKLDFERLKL